MSTILGVAEVEGSGEGDDRKVGVGSYTGLGGESIWSLPANHALSEGRWTGDTVPLAALNAGNSDNEWRGSVTLWHVI